MIVVNCFILPVLKNGMPPTLSCFRIHTLHLAVLLDLTTLWWMQSIYKSRAGLAGGTQSRYTSTHFITCVYHKYDSWKLDQTVPPTYMWVTDMLAAEITFMLMFVVLFYDAWFLLKYNYLLTMHIRPYHLCVTELKLLFFDFLTILESLVDNTCNSTAHLENADIIKLIGRR